MELIVIAAVGADNMVIGRGGALPWKIPDESRQFLGHIRGHTVVMGRRSWEIFGDDLTSKHHVVLTRSPETVRGAITVPNFEQALEHAEALGSSKVFIAGGATVYRQALPVADALYISWIKGDFEGDTYFPAFDLGTWAVESCREHPSFEFVVYGRKGVA